MAQRLAHGRGARARALEELPILFFGHTQSVMTSSRSKPVTGDRIPSLESEWTDDAWHDVPVWPLYWNQPAAFAPVFLTEVKIMQNGTTEAVMARCAEPHGTVVEAQERDGPIDHDDSFQVYLDTSGSRTGSMPSGSWL